MSSGHVQQASNQTKVDSGGTEGHRRGADFPEALACLIWSSSVLDVRLNSA